MSSTNCVVQFKVHFFTLHRSHYFVKKKERGLGMFACKVVAVTCLIEREMMVKKTPLFAVVRSTILSMERTWFLEALWYCTQMIIYV